MTCGWERGLTTEGLRDWGADERVESRKETKERAQKRVESCCSLLSTFSSLLSVRIANWGCWDLNPEPTDYESAALTG